MSSTSDGRDGREGRGDQPTEYLGHTSDPTRAYGSQGTGRAWGETGYRPTEALPAGQYPPDPYATGQYPPDPYATGQYPPGQYPPDPYATGQYPPGQYPPGGDRYGEAPPLDGSGGGGRGPNKGLIVGVVAALVIALVGLGAWLLYDSQSSSTTAAPAITPRSSAPSTTTTPPPTTTPETTPSLPGLDQIPGGVGEALGTQGATVGRIVSNDGTTLVLEAIGGSTVTVTTTPQTRVLALGAGSVADLRTGTSVVVQGSPLENGTITAEVIVSGGF
ncbi:hypothetical protein [Rhodococcoides corynebacterioides]|uniref:hypothetical protein n=1 Tax=Rhodococcoides corynebacterioides TaxID=53972 RepID=UPI003ADB61C0